MPFLIGLSVLAFAATLLVLALRRPGPQPGELLRVRESPAVAVLGVLLWGFSVFLLVWMSGLQLPAGPAVLATEYGLCLLIGLVLGGVSLLWYFVRCIVATEQGVLAVGMTGGRQLLRWDQITRLKLENGRLLLLDVAGRQCAVGGSRAAQLAFARLARARLREGVGKPVLDALEQKLSR